MPQLHVMDLRHAATVINESCLNHGFFQVINHGVDPRLKLADKVVRPPQDIIICRGWVQTVSRFHMVRFA
jgi:hypothetical protein